jgi:hypothetical protein
MSVPDCLFNNLDDFLVEFGEEPLGNEDDSLRGKKGSVVFHT